MHSSSLLQVLLVCLHWWVQAEQLLVQAEWEEWIPHCAMLHASAATPLTPGGPTPTTLASALLQAHCDTLQAARCCEPANEMHNGMRATS